MEPNPAKIAAISAIQGVSEDEALLVAGFAEMDSVDKGSARGAEEALPVAESILKATREAKDARMEATVLVAISTIHVKRCTSRKQSYAQQACDAAEKAVQIAKSVGARDVEGDALHALAAGFAARRLFEDCSKVALQALDIFNEMVAVKQAAVLLTNMAVWYLAAGSADQAKQLVEDALGYFRVHLSQHDEEAEAAAVGVQCKVLLSLGRPTKALVACRRALKRFREIKGKKGEGCVLEMIVNCYIAKDDAVGGIRATSEAIDFFNEESNLVAKIRMLLAQALLYSKDGKYGPAQEASELAFHTSQTTQSTRDEALALHAKAEIYFAAGEYEPAIEKLKEEQRLYREEVVDKHANGVATLFLSSVLARTEAKDEAWRCISEAKALFKAAELQEGTALAFQQEAELHLAQGNPQQAFDCLTQAAPIFAEAGKYPAQVQCLLMLSELATEQKRYNEAQKIAVEAAALAKQLGNVVLSAAASGTLAQASLEIFNYGAAIEACKECIVCYGECNDLVGKAYGHAMSAHAHNKHGDKPTSIKEAATATAIFKALGDTVGIKFVEGLAIKAPAVAAAAARGAEGAQQEEVAQRTQKAPVGDLATIEIADDEALLQSVTEIARQIIGMDEDDEFEADTPLMSAGLGSRQSVVFQAAIAGQLTGTNVPATLAFDYPSAREVSNYLASQLGLTG